MYISGILFTMPPMWFIIIILALLLLVISVVFILAVVRRNKLHADKMPIVTETITLPKKPGKHDWLKNR